jgi:hypothetical protein
MHAALIALAEPIASANYLGDYCGWFSTTCGFLCRTGGHA